MLVSEQRMITNASNTDYLHAHLVVPGQVETKLYINQLILMIIPNPITPHTEPASGLDSFS